QRFPGTAGSGLARRGIRKRSSYPVRRAISRISAWFWPLPLTASAAVTAASHLRSDRFDDLRAYVI
ncbi:hypothetical protein ABTH42_19220, partial [Acinetobacter baumannii]